MKTLILAAAMAAFALPAAAQSTTTNPPGASQSVNSEKVSTAAFARLAALGSMFEVQSSQLALERSQNKGIRAFAEAMVKDHTTMGEALKSLVEPAMIPDKLDERHAPTLEKLHSAPGTDFDRSYRSMQISAHEDAVTLFQSFIDNGDNAKLQAWAAQALPVLQQHLQKAKELALPTTTGQLQ